MHEWKHHITLGNRQFVNHDFDRAQSSYAAALQAAERLFPRWSEPNEAVSMIVVTHHNIADLYQKLGLVCSARHVLEKAHSMLLNALSNTPSNHARHQALLRGTIKTYAALNRHKNCCLLASSDEDIVPTEQLVTRGLNLSIR
ncbi:hypothetical protein [Arenicella xantha]|uniref:Tetratricopeptide repeat protein n=1 Tax=Arenicella xantha TaxID=644221 RepID=A0A395JIV2_9GAMM|nr:hypothetical protein [Arenicella xantha]RBP50652.1 hypothetical protein DFR28_10263 [Arenicella xantha]